MIGVVVVTHGQLAVELVHGAETIVGDLPHVTAVSIGWHEDTQEARDEIARAIDRVQREHGVLIVTDMFGGTPANLAMTFLEVGKIEVVTGVNLPMLIKLAQVSPEEPLASVARMLRDTGQSSIYIASELLAPKKQA